MMKERVKTNYYALVGIVLGIISTFILQTPLIPLVPAAALIISVVGIFEARKTETGLTYAVVGFILGLFVLIYYFSPL